MDPLGISAIIAATSTLLVAITGTVVALRVVPPAGKSSEDDKGSKATINFLPPTSPNPGEAVANGNDK